MSLGETEEERFYRQGSLRARSEQGICGDGIYHYDTPLTREHGVQVLREAGSSSVAVPAGWGAAAAVKAAE